MKGMKMMVASRILLIALTMACWQTAISFAQSAEVVTLELHNTSRFAIRIEAVHLGSDCERGCEADWKNSERQVVHLDDGASSSIQTVSGTHLILISNPTGAWTYFHALVWDTSEITPWIKRKRNGNPNAFRFEISAYVYNIYTLERPRRGADRLWLAPRDNRLSDFWMKRPEESSIGKTCNHIQELQIGTEVAFWSSEKDRLPRFFKRVGPHLCGVGQNDDYFYLDGMLSAYGCNIDRTDCIREPENDLIYSKLLMTKDAALWLSDLYRNAILPWMRNAPQIEGIRQLHSVSVDSANFWFAEYVPLAVTEDGCPVGFRLHYQGRCINLEDEKLNHGNGPVRMVNRRE